MSFLNPFFLIGLTALAIPVIIHLINLKKPKRITFSTTAFFSELRKTTIRRLNIKRWLLLAARSLAIMFLVFALARPFLPPQLSGFTDSGTTLYGFLIDNSPSMAQIDEKGPYLDQAKIIMEEILDQAGSEDRFLISVTHGPQPGFRIVTRSEARAILEDVEVANMGNFLRRYLTELKTRMLDFSSDSKVVYWFSDATQATMQQLENIDAKDHRLPFQFIQIGSQPSVNVGITSVSSPNQIIGQNLPMTIEISVQNFSNSAVSNYFLDLEMEGRSLGQYEVSLEPGHTRSFLFEYVPEKSGDVRGLARLEGDAFAFDNTRYFALKIPETRNVLLIERPEDQASSFVAPVLEAARTTSAQLSFVRRTPDALQQEELSRFDAVILNGLAVIPGFLQENLQRFVQDGGGLIVFPGQQADLGSYNAFLRRLNVGQFSGFRGTYGRFEQVASFQQLREGHPVLDEIFEAQEDAVIRIALPDIYHHWLYDTGRQSGTNVVLRSNLNEPLLTEHRLGAGLILISSLGSDPGWSNLPVNPLFAPLYYRMALYVVSFEEGGLQEALLGEPFSSLFSFEQLDVSMFLNDLVIRPEVTITGSGMQVRTDAIDWEPGWAEITDNRQSRVIGVNQKVSESDFRVLSSETIKEKLSETVTVLDIIQSSAYTHDELTSRIQRAGFGSEIWNWFLWLALVFLIAESLIAKQYRVEQSS